MFTIAVIGPVEVRRDDGAVRIPAGKTAELLVRLALEAGELVSSDRLIEDLWATDGLQTRRNTLQSKVVKLRRALGDPAVVDSRDGGYRLVVDRSHVDALAAIDGAAAARDAHAAGDDRRAVELCASMLARFGSDPLVGAGDGAWAAPYRARLDATRRQLIETWCAARLRLGAPSAVIGTSRRPSPSIRSTNPCG